MNFHVILVFLCTLLILVPLLDLATSHDAFHYDDDGTGGSERDRVALLAFTSNIKSDPQGVLTSWNNSSPFCKWEGVTCGRKHRRVTVLDLQSRGLVGTLSPHIGNLTFLRNITLSNNTFHGKLPPEIGRLFRLQNLWLNNNSLQGEIPANLGSLSKLETIYISRNNFTGGIPHSLGNLTCLKSIAASRNKFQGSIPDIFHRLTNLKRIGLGGNELIDGTIPPSLYNLSQLTHLSLGGNQLHGTLPLNFGLLFPKLEFLQIRNCHFTGPIPFSLSNATQLETIEMDENNFSGKVSVEFKDMKFLTWFGIFNNNLGTGLPDDLDFLISLLNCSRMDYVSIARNNIGGALPDYIGNISTSIRQLYIGYNKIHGHIPSWIGTLTNLEIFSMHVNQFNGAIPETIGQLQKLDHLDFSENKLSGQIPSYIGNLTSLSTLRLFENRLSGAVPASLGKCKNLEYFIVYQNNLSGNIPKEIFEISTLISLLLYKNHFTGFLPSEIGGLRHLMALYLFDNELFGSIPGTLGGCDSLQYLLMQNNFFNGSLPRALSSLRGVEAIDLSHNNLSGEVPNYLENISLIYLNLSFNDFEGEIPTKGIFTNTSIVSLEGNKRLCGGVTGLKFHKCPSKEHKRRTIFSLTIIIVTIICSVSGVILLLLFIFFRFKRIRNVKTCEHEKTVMKVSYGMLHKATDGFSAANLLGLGSFGSVFKGVLNSDEQIVAIKVLNLQRRGASKSFMAECEALKNIRHRNLVKIITSCSSVDYQGNDFKALVYDFMPKGNLDMWLHQIPESTASGNLNLLQRINIVIDVACAIDYLHHHCHLPIIHCDLKPSNILLNDDMTAHIGDFGIAKFLQELSTPDNQTSSIGIRGTLGYAPPEYGIGSAVSTRGDIYSFGIILLEMITGKRPTDGMFEGGLNLRNFARLALSGGLIEIMDPELLSTEAEEAEAKTNTNKRSVVVQAARNGDAKDMCLISMVNIGIACSMEAPQDRMDIAAAVHELHIARDILSATKKKQILGN